MGVVIRAATAQDYDQLCEIIDQVDGLHRDHLPHLFQAPDGPVRDRDYILHLIRDEDAGLFVAAADGRLLGFVTALIQETPAYPIVVPRRYAVVDNLAVREEARRAGIGRALLTKTHEWAISRGATSVELNVYEFNESGIAFYKALGYETLSRKMTLLLT